MVHGCDVNSDLVFGARILVDRLTNGFLGFESAGAWQKKILRSVAARCPSQLQLPMGALPSRMEGLSLCAGRGRGTHRTALPSRDKAKHCEAR